MKEHRSNLGHANHLNICLQIGENENNLCRDGRWRDRPVVQVSATSVLLYFYRLYICIAVTSYVDRFLFCIEMSNI
jgi:hypothetical protein